MCKSFLSGGHCAPGCARGPQTLLAEAPLQGTLKGPLSGSPTSSLLGFISTLAEVMRVNEKL